MVRVAMVVTVPMVMTVVVPMVGVVRGGLRIGCAHARGATARPLVQQKENTTPTSKVANRSCAPAWLSNASGSRCMAAVASKAPRRR